MARTFTDEAMRRVGPKLDKFMRGLTLEAMGRIVKRTPVDLGRARANWNVSRGEPDVSTTEATDKSGRRTLMRAASVVSGQKDFASGKPIYIANGLPYIVPLENGHSKSQAPRGMVKLTLRELEPMTRKIAREVRREAFGG